MEWYIEWYREDPNVKVEVEDRRLTVNFDVSHRCPGCILQILVSRSKDRWEELATKQGYGGKVTLTYDIPSGIDEVFVATDAQYSVADAVARYPKNLLCRVYQKLYRGAGMVTLSFKVRNVGNVEKTVYIGAGIAKEKFDPFREGFPKDKYVKDIYWRDFSPNPVTLAPGEEESYEADITDYFEDIPEGSYYVIVCAWGKKTDEVFEDLLAYAFSNKFSIAAEIEVVEVSVEVA